MAVVITHRINRNDQVNLSGLLAKYQPAYKKPELRAGVLA